jgi:error-prone DNA polymerase
VGVEAADAARRAAEPAAVPEVLSAVLPLRPAAMPATPAASSSGAAAVSVAPAEGAARDGGTATGSKAPEEVGARGGRRTGPAARRTALWRLGAAAPGTPTPEGTQLSLPLDLPGAPQLDPLGSWDAMVADYVTTGLTLGAHPVEILRPQLPPGNVSTRDLERLPHEARVQIGGLVVARQRPGTAKGIVFILLEDEFGTINLIVPPPVYERHRLIARTEPLLLATGRLEKLPIAGGALNVYVNRLEALDAPATGGGDVVPLPERGTESGARPVLAAVAVGGAAAPPAGEVPGDEGIADFRGGAPAVQSFAAGRRR